MSKYQNAKSALEATVQFWIDEVNKKLNLTPNELKLFRDELEDYAKFYLNRDGAYHSNWGSSKNGDIESLLKKVGVSPNQVDSYVVFSRTEHGKVEVKVNNRNKTIIWRK